MRKHYWCYIRDFHEGVRDIRVATSTDFRTWTEPERITFVDSPDEPLYTNQVRPYDRAPHLFLGFPTRYVERRWSPTFDALPDPAHRQARMKFSPRFGTAVTDGQFMTSRDGRTFRRWDETFLRPGPERKDNWLYGDGYQSLGLLETAADDPTAPPELSIYVGEDHWKRPTRLRRYTLRVDGFVALHARRKAGELVTKPFVFRGKTLSLNFATSAAGNLRVEVDDLTGRPLPGFTLRRLRRDLRRLARPHGHLEGERRPEPAGRQAGPPPRGHERCRPVLVPVRGSRPGRGPRRRRSQTPMRRLLVVIGLTGAP